MKKNTEEVTTRSENGACFIKFYNSKANALTSHIINQLQKEITLAEADSSISSIILCSAGEKAFCAGADINELKSLTTEKELEDYFYDLSLLLLQITKVEKPVIARVQGKIVGGALGIVAACDYSIARADASAKLSELSIGIGPLVIEPFLSKKISQKFVQSMTYDAKWRTADWCQQVGLYDQIAQDIKELDSLIKEQCNLFQAVPLKSFNSMKKIFSKNSDDLKTLLKERSSINAKLALQYLVS